MWQQCTSSYCRFRSIFFSNLESLKQFLSKQGNRSKCLSWLCKKRFLNIYSTLVTQSFPPDFQIKPCAKKGPVLSYQCGQLQSTCSVLHEKVSVKNKKCGMFTVTASRNNSITEFYIIVQFVTACHCVMLTQIDLWLLKNDIFHTIRDQWA